jgi:carbamoyl-phosphate synthase large subunit
MTTLLITGIGGDIAQGAARIVRQVRPDWRIVGVDIHERHGGALFADAVEVVPPVAASDYLEAMGRVVRRHGVDVCLPMSEAELGFIVSRALPSFADAPFIGVSARAIEIGLDKLATARFLVESGLPAPWTTAATGGAKPPSLPCIFKPRRSAGSKGVFVCRDEAEAAWYASREANGVFQELLLPADREVTCAVYRGRDGATAVLPMLRQLVGGFTGWAEVIDDPEAVRQCTVLARALDLRGPMNAQMRITAKGPRIFEINPRLSSTVYLRHLLGFRDVQWLLDEYEGREVSFARIESGTIAVRIQDAAVLAEKDR